MSSRLFRWLLAELIGTALLVLFGPGSVVAALALGDGSLDYAGLGMIALSFGLVVAIIVYALGTTSAVDRRAPSGFAGLLIGLAVTAEILLIGPITGGSVNPARTFGPYVANSLFGGATPWSEILVYVVGPLIGGVLATLAYDLVARPVREVPEKVPQGTEGEIEGRRVPSDHAVG